MKISLNITLVTDVTKTENIKMMDDSEKCPVTTLASIEEEYNDTQLLVTNILEDVVGTAVKTVDNISKDEETGKLAKQT